MRRIAAALATLTALGGCFPARVDTFNVNAVSPADRASAAQIQLVAPGAPTPPGLTYVGPVEGYSCKHLLWEPPASQSNAIEQLRISAWRKGASVVTDFSCTASGTDAYGTNCWNAIQCGGSGMRASVP